MKVLLIIGLIFLSGCVRRTITVNGETITCDVIRHNCGLSLMTCTNGKEYECVNDVELVK